MMARDEGDEQETNDEQEMKVMSKR